MAKRKAARTSRRKTAAKASRSRKAARKRLAPKRGARKAARKTARSKAKPAARKKSSRRAGAATRTTSRRRTAATSKATARRKTAVKTARPKSRPARVPPAPRAVRPAAPRKIVARKAPALSRERRTISDDDVVPTPPSTLDLDRSASAVRSGRRELRERFDQHTETGPALTGGDVDGDWESAYSVGDEAPGGDSPTPDQDIVDDIGRAMGNEYQDNEELKGAEKITQRDRHRWELDPASSEDYDDR